MKQEVYDRLLQHISNLRQDNYATKLSILINSARMHNNIDLLDITYNRINKDDYNFGDYAYQKRQQIEIYKSIMTYYGKNYEADDDVEKFIDETIETDLPIKLIHNGMKNHILTHCFPGGLLEKIKTEGLDTKGDVNNYKKLNEILSKVDISIPSYYTNHLGNVSFMRDSDAEHFNYYLTIIPEWFNLFLTMNFGVSREDYNEKNYDKILDSVKNTLLKLRESNKLTDEELYYLKDYLKENIDLYCQKFNPGIAILKKEYDVPIETIKDIFTEDIFDLNGLSKEDRIDSLMDDIFSWQEEVIKGPIKDMDIVQTHYYKDSEDIGKEKDKNQQRAKPRA